MKKVKLSDLERGMTTVEHGTVFYVGYLYQHALDVAVFADGKVVEFRGFWGDQPEYTVYEPRD